MTNLSGNLIQILMGDAQECTYAELDARFFTELDALHLSEADESTVVGAWIALFDHVITDRRALTSEENTLICQVWERILMRHGYCRMIPSVSVVVGAGAGGNGGAT